MRRRFIDNVTPALRRKLNFDDLVDNPLNNNEQSLNDNLMSLDLDDNTFQSNSNSRSSNLTSPTNFNLSPLSTTIIQADDDDIYDVDKILGVKE